MENKSERWKAVRSDLMAKILYNLLSTNSKKRIEGTVMGWQIPVLYKLPMILEFKLMIPEQSSDQDGLRN